MSHVYRISERRKAFYFFCGAMPAVLFLIIRLGNAYEDPTLILDVIPTVTYAIGVCLLLGSGSELSSTTYTVATVLLLIGAVQWGYETYEYVRHYDVVRSEGRADSIGLFVRLLFLMAISVAIHCTYRGVRDRASNNALEQTRGQRLR